MILYKTETYKSIGDVLGSRIGFSVLGGLLGELKSLQEWKRDTFRAFSSALLETEPKLNQMKKILDIAAKMC